MTFTRSAWLDIDLGAIRHNIAEVQRYVGPNTAVFTVVKANAYGHGLVPCANACIQAGANGLAVALVEEGVELRQAGVDGPILIMGLALPDQSELIVSHRLSQTVSSADMVHAISKAAVAAGRTVGQEVGLHVKVDSGMGRIGVRPELFEDLLDVVIAADGVSLEGVSTHIAWDETKELGKADDQLAVFAACAYRLSARGDSIRWRHASNSVMTVQRPAARYEMVRVGLLTYGIPPAGGPEDLDLRPAMTLTARIAQLKQMSPGETLSYGGTHTVEKTSRVALLPIGYADGYPRSLSNRADVLVHGKRCPQVGRICMDQLLVDVSDVIEAAVGDEAVLLGRSGGEEITVWELAEKADSIHHEIVSRMGSRLPRRFIE